MSGCTAVKCSNTRSKGFRLFRFPRDPNRRKIWLQNYHRDKWQPTNHFELCEDHFEERQFEQHRLDGLQKLKPNAIPTLFDIPNPPHLLEPKRKSLYKLIESLKMSDEFGKLVFTKVKDLTGATLGIVSWIKLFGDYLMLLYGAIEV
ncbi:THAP domain-containing protein 4-like [Acyrthosiphon pisum]|uniref:THAP-type domain-containing protein n=1 Tax=Acyrthosiphon pisum TaxID=7029 RepID=A0A8R2H8S7_ACYPI|nr:THAP domain-containing protein 4-like [Acyrthosiphon pisum]|eukprot:XP_016661072.1 PREDICTED: THAP domain-containing protein 4-like [Acyrthosiphon pisum]